MSPSDRPSGHPQESLQRRLRCVSTKRHCQGPLHAGLLLKKSVQLILEICPELCLSYER